MAVRKIIKRTLAVLVGLVLLVVVAGGYLAYSFIVPDSSKFGTVLDEAKRAGHVRDYFKAADDPYYAEMDKGVLKKPAPGESYSPEIQRLAKLAGLDNETVRQHAIKGQNTWTVWTGGNDRFWNGFTQSTVGGFDLLKLISSHKNQGYGRRNRWYHLGLVNEPCFAEPDGPDEVRFGLWLDVRVPSPGCPDQDPFADAEKYPGVKIGARGRKLNGGAVFPVGSAYGEPTGIMGLRLFTNPDFNAVAEKHWDAEKYYNDPDYYNDSDLVRPYRVGMSCGFCHTGPSPVNPPPNPEKPEFANLNSNPGAQYYWVDRIFFWDTRPREDPTKPEAHENNVIFQLLHTNPPGTLDTSLISTDYNNNPRTMNAVYSLLARLEPTLRWGKEKLAGGELDNKQFQDYPQTGAFAEYWNARTGEIKTARVLKDGSDSVGILGALNRVYLNIGLFSEEWLLHFRPVIGGRKISPIKIADAVKNSAYWGATEDQTADMAIFFLVTATPDSLKDLDGDRGKKHLQAPPGTVHRGKIVFAENCAACHSSHIPTAPIGSGIDDGICAGGGNGPDYRQCWDRYWSWVQTDEFKAEMTKIVLAEDFLDDNFLSSERRIPVDLLQTNACGPIATNALAGDIWDNFSAASYKALPPVKELTVHHPVSGGVSSFQPLGAGRGYTRPASLVSVWSSAPLLLNNSVGLMDPYSKGGYYGAPTGDAYGSGYGAPKTYGEGGGSSTGYQEAGYGYTCPAASDTDPYLPCVDNRMRVFDDSIRKLLSPELRRKDTHTALPVPGYMYRTSALTCVRVPKGYMPGIVQTFPGFFNWLADWAIDEEGNVELGPLPKGFPINALVNTKVLPDNDEPGGFGHAWKILKAGPTLLGTFKKLGGQCSAEELADPGTQVMAENVLRETGFVDTLVGLSKCPDYVVNRGHYFGSDLPNADKEALIELLKTF